MIVLSLFDGISCGRVALERSGIKVDKYFASEIDKYAITITQANYPDIIQLGDIKNIKGKDLPKIDLLIGGFPCQSFSFCGKQLNFDDPRGKLFFECVRLLEECRPNYFLLENVKMKKEYQSIINKYLGYQPYLINSSNFSKQNRPRLYWTNLYLKSINNKSDNFNNWLYRLGHGYIKDEIKFYSKYPTLAAQSPSTKYRIIKDINKVKDIPFKELRRNNDLTRSATPEECEEFQTLPIGYTKLLKKTQRYKCIGNGWTVDVVKHIFDYIPR